MIQSIAEHLDNRYGYKIVKFINTQRFVYGELPFSTWESIGIAIACYLVTVFSLRWLMRDVKKTQKN